MSNRERLDTANDDGLYEENFISGIFNYCDRWCERCAFTSRCRVYADENEGPDDPESRDITNAKFWRKLESIFEQAHQMIARWAEENGVDLSALDTDEAREEHRRRMDSAEHHPLALAARNYAERVSEWFKATASQTQTFADSGVAETPIDETEDIDQAREVIYWYQFQIAAKLIRGLMSRHDEEEDELDDDFPRDSEGSIKVALIAMDRSISAWRIRQMGQPEKAESIVPLLLALEKLRQGTEQLFPTARDFIRPGFDEVSDELIA